MEIVKINSLVIPRSMLLNFTATFFGYSFGAKDKDIGAYRIGTRAYLQLYKMLNDKEKEILQQLIMPFEQDQPDALKNLIREQKELFEDFLNDEL